MGCLPASHGNFEVDLGAPALHSNWGCWLSRPDFRQVGSLAPLLPNGALPPCASSPLLGRPPQPCVSPPPSGLQLPVPGLPPPTRRSTHQLSQRDCRAKTTMLPRSERARVTLLQYPYTPKWERACPGLDPGSPSERPCAVHTLTRRAAHRLSRSGKGGETMLSSLASGQTGSTTHRGRSARSQSAFQ